MGSRQRYIVEPIASVDGIALVQVPSSGGLQDLILNGGLTVDGSFNLRSDNKPAPTSFLIQITSVADETGRTFTVIGLDERGQPSTDSFLGANNGDVSSSKYFSTVTQITVDDDTTAAVRSGIDGRSVSPWVVINNGSQPLDIGFETLLSSGGVLTYSVEQTFDDIQVLGNVTINTQEHDDVKDKTESDTGNYAFPSVACRVVVKAFTSGTLTATFIQSF